MKNLRTILAALAAATVAAAASCASAIAGDQYTFPSVNGVALSGGTSFVAPQGVAPVMSGVYGASSIHDLQPLPLATPAFNERFAMQRNSDAFGYRFLTHALASQAFANYAADYARLFAPAYAVTAWTDRTSGFVDVGYGGAVDSWTAGAYYMSRVRGPNRRRDSAPDLSTMPEFKPHPELKQNPTFLKSN